MKKILLLASFAFYVLAISAQTELVVEVKTDEYAEETTWELYDLDKNLILKKDSLNDVAVNRDTIILDDSKCYYWTIFDSYGDGFSGPTPGLFKLYKDGAEVFVSENPNFGESFSVYNLGAMCNSNDVEIVDLSLNNYINQEEQAVGLIVLNIGSEVISTVELSYKVNDTEVSAATVSGLSIEIGASLEVLHPTMFDFKESGDYNVSVSIKSVNGVNTHEIVNNNFEKSITVVNGYVKHNVIEDFMSYDCGPCGDADIKLKNALHNYEGTYSLIKYMSWDFADRKYFLDVERYLDFYGARGLPHIVFNGKTITWTTFSEGMYADSLGLSTPIKINADAEVIGDSIYTNVSIYSNVDINDELVLRGVVVERECVDVSLNYENRKPFNDVAYGLIGDFNAAILENGIKAGELVSYSFVKEITSYKFEEDTFEDLGVIVYLQDPGMFIYQTYTTDALYKSNPLQIEYNIEDKAEKVDTAGLKVNILANRQLLNLEGKKIQNITDHIEFKQTDENGVRVPILASYINNRNIIIVPEYGWDLNTTYYVEVNNFMTIDGEVLEKESISFTTKSKETGITDASQTFSVFPNPVTNILTCTHKNMSSARIYGITGNIVGEYIVNDNTLQIDFSEYENGVYVIEIESEGTLLREKVIKK